MKKSPNINSTSGFRFQEISHSFCPNACGTKEQGLETWRAQDSQLIANGKPLLGVLLFPGERM